MVGLICNVWMAKLNDAGYALTQADLDAEMAAERATAEAGGTRSILFCDSAWSNEHWPAWGVGVSPNLESYLEAVEAQEKRNWFRHFLRNKSLLGTPQGEIPAHTPADGEIYKLWMATTLPTAYAMTPEQFQEALAYDAASLAQVGGKQIVMCNSRWADEEWQSWGVEVFPDIKAVQEHARLLNEKQWLRYVDSWTILGTAMQM